MSLVDQGVYVRFIELPPHIKGVTLPNPDGTFDVYINSTLSEYQQKSALKHEINHINLNHFYEFKDCLATQEMAASV
jgi:hypothetical protein